MEIGQPTPSASLELCTTLQIAQTYLLELIAHNDPAGKYARAYELVRDAYKLVEEN